MAKRADYGVLRVKYDNDHAKIVEVEVRPDRGEDFGDAQKVRRQDVVSAIDDQNVTFVTVYLKDGKHTKGEDVRVVMVGNEKYLRTDTNSIRADNLGSLPEYK
ncbi:hypothetical protein MFUL124B02_27260 [Myxococcus fulvus 124B02]|nr:hypothetical protein MFUL124B02_27260 [Myxococcus fulvus 124B02]